ncbi:MAG: DUF1016 N-terminal domain-containing protein [Planctomycetota bacterium]
MKKTTDTTLTITADYRHFIEELKARATTARLFAARRVNHEMIFLYWDIGRGIVEKQQALGWGESVVEMVAGELRRAFPSMSGFSPRNVRDMKRFYLAYSDEAIWRQAVAKLPKGEKGTPIWPQAVAKLEAPDDPMVILRQSVAELEKGGIWLQPVAKLNADTVIPFLQQLVAEIPWGQNLLILNKLTEPAARLWYLRATARFGWSRSISSICSSTTAS